MESENNEYNISDFPEEIIKGNDPIATNLLKQIYSALKDKRPESLSMIELAWVQGIESAYKDKDKIDELQVRTLLEQAVKMLSDTSNWGIDDEDLYAALEKIIFLKSREENFQKFFSTMEDAISSILQLDFSKKVPLSSFTKDSRNVFNYAALSLNMIIEKMETSVISNKAVNSVFAKIPGIAVLVTGTDYKIRFINELSERLIEQSIDEMVGKPVNELIEDYGEIRKIFEIENEVKNKLVNLKIPGNNTAKIPLFLTIPTPRKDSSEIGEVVHILRTTTIDSETEKVFNLTQEAHDKIAPINSALGITSILKRRFDDPESEELLGMLERSLNNLKSNAQKTLLAVGVNQPDTIELVDVYNLVSSIKESISYMAGYKDVYISTRITCQKPFYTFQKHLGSIIQNLLTNAIKYRDVTKPNRDILITIVDAASGINISVKDNGIGINDENISLIFNRGYKVDKHSEGNGSGLFVLQESVDKLKGSLDVESTIGDGTHFKIYLPSLA